ncbi:DUF6769 family protein [Bacteroides fragilis]
MFATWLQEIYSIFVPKVKTKQMKRIFFVYPLAIATLFLIVLSAIPHHHHKEMMCTVMELCEQDDIYNDGHTDHEAGQDAHNENTCVSQAGYIFPSSVDKSNLHDGSLMNIHLSVLYLFADILTIHFDIPIPENTYDRYVVSYTSVVLGESSGLRAPPCFFS